MSPREAEPLNIERAPKARSLPAGPPTIRRLAYEDVLSRSPGHFFERMPVTPYIVGRRFVGYSILSLYGNARPHPEGLLVGDVVTRVNGKNIHTPAQFHAVWVAAKNKRTLEVDVLRDNAERRIVYRIID